MIPTSFTFTYVGRKTAWYVFKQTLALLIHGKAWFRVNFTSTRECLIMDAADIAGQIYDNGGNGTITIINGEIQ